MQRCDVCFYLGVCAEWVPLNAEVSLVQGHLFVVLLSQQDNAAPVHTALCNWLV